MSVAIECAGLHKTFVKRRRIREILRHPLQRKAPIRALRGVDLAVREGETFGLLGPNGAGKTTLLKIFSCLVLPDRGQARVGGFATLEENRVKRVIGLVHSDERSFYWRLSGRENLRFFARLYDVPRARTESRIDELVSRVEMTEAVDRPFADYSSGMKQRMAIVRALLHDPPILLMDEPTRSLDPASSLGLRRFIQEELNGRDGKTILIASHNLREIEALADRLAILIRGKVRQVGTPAEVRRSGIDEATFELELDPGTAIPDGPFRTLSDETREGCRALTVALDDGARLNDLLRALLNEGAVIRSCRRVEPDLEQAFTRIVDSVVEGE